MVLTHTTNHTYAHPFPTVTLAFFLRYCSPQLNPFAQHVLSTDTLASHVDPQTGRLHTTRIHLKKSRMPKAVLALLPVSITGGVAEKTSYILETSVVDMRQGWMQTESRNLNFTGVLSVVEKQTYYNILAAAPEQPLRAPAAAEMAAAPSASLPSAQRQQQPASASPSTPATGVETTVIFRSRLGERIRERFDLGFKTPNSLRPLPPSTSSTSTLSTQDQQSQSQPDQQQAQIQTAPQGGWLSAGWIGGLGAKGIQRSIEAIASTKTLDQLSKSREGMRMILERLRQSGGIINVLELRRRAMEGKLDALEFY